MDAPASPPDAAADLAVIAHAIRRAQERIDPHAFHFVHWGLLVLVTYPMINWLALEGRTEAMAWVGGGALLTGILLSFVREWRLGGRPRVAGEDTFVGRQVARVTFACIFAGAVLSAVAPSTGTIAEDSIPIVWGLVYANLAVMVGIVYRREFAWSGVVIFAASLASMFVREHAGFVLGPAMGLGILVPGIMAEQRVRALRAEAPRA